MAAGASASTPAQAGPLLDYIRNYDLNDYALGVSISWGQSPYATASNSTFAYPYLTSFRHSALTDDWLVLRDGDIGARWVSPGGWEFGAVARVNTLGLGDADPAFVRGLDERQWTLEAGPMIGWRGWPVHVNFKAYAELLGRRDGYPAELSISLPAEHARGWIVPSIDLLYQNQDYNRYYFGVTPAEAISGRPAYDPAASLGWRLKARLGYRIADNWLLSTTVAWESLGDEITASPLVDRDSLWSASIGVAYDVDLFQPRDGPGAKLEPRPFELRLGAFRDQVDTRIVRTAATANASQSIDVEEVFGAAEDSTLLQVDAVYRIGNYHRLHVGHFSIGRRSTATLDDDVEFGDLVIPAGTEVAVRADLSTLVFTYSYSLMRDAQKELGLTFGVHNSTSTVALRAEPIGADASRLRATLPVIGLHGSVSLGADMHLGARLQIFRMDADRFEGLLNFATLELGRRFGESISVGIGYNYYGMKLTSSNDDLRGRIEVRHQGPVLYLGANF
ncbi:MAG: MipA/OmpV family protein [Gammaproteobacteria bacterium]|nr:MipA/OmpV family protein [Gammaproteobacteria bacterium]MDH4253477.1 MipA/OmpV family protein [Gammaproteobacteria bacterium]